MAAASSRRRFAGGFVCGAAAGAAASCWAAWRLLRSQSRPEPAPPPPQEPPEEALLEEFGFPKAGTETHCYTNHALSYDQAKRVPRWVLEHISKQKTLGDADRRHCKFRPDPNIPLMFSAVNEDYIGSGWSRGHMAPAGDNKFSTRAMAETFYLSNIVPQNYENNAGFWNRMEMYCRELTERFEDVWVVSGPLTLPETGDDGKKRVTYQASSSSLGLTTLVFHKCTIGFGLDINSEVKFSVELKKMMILTCFPCRYNGDMCHVPLFGMRWDKCDVQTRAVIQTTVAKVIGKDDVAVPSHLYKVILARRSRTTTEPLVLGAFVVPNDPIGFSHQLAEFQVNIEDLEKMSGLVFFPQVDKIKDVKNICDVDTCKLMGFKEFTLYITARKVQSARTLHRLEKVMSELKEAGIEPDEYLLKLHRKKEEELMQEKQLEAREGKAG